MQEYVCGFAFDRTEHVVLIKKQRPAWQSELMNGIGGKVEVGESPLSAMVREFTEETGTVCEEWSLYANIVFPTSKIYFYRAFLEDLQGMRTVTDEEIIVAPLIDIKSSECVANLFWLLPLAAFTKENYEPITVTVDSGEARHMITDTEADAQEELMSVAMRKAEVDACLE